MLLVNFFYMKIKSETHQIWYDSCIGLWLIAWFLWFSLFINAWWCAALSIWCVASTPTDAIIKFDKMGFWWFWSVIKIKITNFLVILNENHLHEGDFNQNRDFDFKIKIMPNSAYNLLIIATINMGYMIVWKEILHSTREKLATIWN